MSDLHVAVSPLLRVLVNQALTLQAVMAGIMSMNRYGIQCYRKDM